MGNENNIFHQKIGEVSVVPNELNIQIINGNHYDFDLDGFVSQYIKDRKTIIKKIRTCLDDLSFIAKYPSIESAKETLETYRENPENYHNIIIHPYFLKRYSTSEIENGTDYNRVRIFSDTNYTNKNAYNDFQKFGNIIYAKIFNNSGLIFFQKSESVIKAIESCDIPNLLVEEFYFRPNIESKNSMPKSVASRISCDLMTELHL